VWRGNTSEVTCDAAQTSNALSTTSTTLCDVSTLPPTTAAVSEGSRRQLCGMMICTGFKQPYDTNTNESIVSGAVLSFFPSIRCICSLFGDAENTKYDTDGRNCNDVTSLDRKIHSNYRTTRKTNSAPCYCWCGKWWNQVMVPRRRPLPR